MSGSGTFVAPAAPDMDFVSTPNPQYRVAFGNCEPGVVLEVFEINNTAQVEFPPNIYAMKVTLNMDNTWTVMQADD